MHKIQSVAITHTHGFGEWSNLKFEQLVALGIVSKIGSIDKNGFWERTIPTLRPHKDIILEILFKY